MTTPVSESVLSAVLDALPTQLAVIDGSGEIRYTNRAWRQFGVENDLAGDPSSVGENYLSVCDASGDENAATAAEGIREVLAGEREEFGFEYPCHSPDERRWFLMRAVPVEVDGDRHAVVMHLNITERREAELAVEEHNEQLEALASVLSHDLRNPLSVALGHAELLAEDTDSEHVRPVERALHRTEAIIDDALVLARGGNVEEPAPVDLATVAEAAWKTAVTDDATLVVVDTRAVRADRNLLAQLFENLFRNAVEHGDAETVRVGLLSNADGFYVEDDGTGVSEDEREQLFEAGYTTADTGTGLGLAIAERVADAHGWTVTATESADGGARFDLSGVELLPAGE